MRCCRASREELEVCKQWEQSVTEKRLTHKTIHVKIRIYSATCFKHKKINAWRFQNAAVRNQTNHGRQKKHGSKHPNPEEGARQRSEVLCPPCFAIRRINQKSRFKCHSHTPAASAGSHAIIKVVRFPLQICTKRKQYFQNVAKPQLWKWLHFHGEMYVTKKVLFFSTHVNSFQRSMVVNVLNLRTFIFPLQHLHLQSSNCQRFCKGVSFPPLAPPCLRVLHFFGV